MIGSMGFPGLFTTVDNKSSLVSIFNKLKEAMQKKDAELFESQVRESVDMFAKNGQMAKKDVAVFQLIQLARRYGVFV